MLGTIKVCWQNAEFLVLNLAINMLQMLSLLFLTKEKRQDMHEIFLLQDPPVGKTEEVYNKYKPLQCQYAYNHEKTH